jgi:hypothetical protein
MQVGRVRGKLMDKWAQWKRVYSKPAYERFLRSLRGYHFDVSDLGRMVIQPIQYADFSVEGYNHLKVVDLALELGGKFFGLGKRRARYIGFFDPDGIRIEEHLDTGDLVLDKPSELQEYLEVFERAIDDYVRQCGLVRTGLPRID